MFRLRALVIAILCPVLLGAGPAVFAQAGMEKASETLEDATIEPEYGFRAGSTVVAPIPFKNPMIGTGLALGAGYLYQTDAKSNTSSFGLGALYSDNGTFGYGASGSLAWGENRWQLSATVAKVDANYDLYILRLPVPINQVGSMFKGSLLYGFTPDLSVGVSLRYMDSTVTSIGGVVLPPNIADDLAMELGNVGVVAKWDTRSNSLFPRAGHLLEFEAIRGQSLDDWSRDYAKAFVNANLYRSLGETTVFAGRLSACSASASTPFFDLCSLGGTDAFRGFSATQYLDETLASVQIEIRQQLSERFRAVAFAGAGMTGPSFSDLSSGGTHVAGGLGLRYKLSKKFDADFSLDASYNDEGQELYYIYVGQRF